MDRIEHRLFTVVTHTFTWRDRLRLLFGRELKVRVETTTDVEVRKAEGRSEVTVAPIIRPRPAKRLPYSNGPRRDPFTYQEGDESDPLFLEYSRRERGALLLRRS
jgi:hypothetical protein